MHATSPRPASSAPLHPGAAGRATGIRPSDHIARRNAVYIAPREAVRMHCQNPACPAGGLIVAVEREALDFAAASKVHVMCRDCRHPLYLIERPLGGAR